MMAAIANRAASAPNPESHPALAAEVSGLAYPCSSGSIFSVKL